MSKVSILIPARKEIYEASPGVTTLVRTVQEVYTKARGEFEVIVAFDGPPHQLLPDYPHLRILTWARAHGTKPVLNDLVQEARGKYIFKLDAHCALSEGFDEVLQSSVQDNWVVMPRFYTLNPETWAWQDERFCDYFMLPCPLTDPKLYRFQAGGYWRERTQERLTIPLDENMKLHGSSFFMAKTFWECMGGLDMSHIDMSSGEDIEISLKAWLGPWDGRLMVNKNVWLAHMHKGRGMPRSWNASQRAINASYLYTANYWMRNAWAGRAHDIDWVVDRFAPMPGWPADWQARQAEYELANPFEVGGPDESSI